jgi:L-threonylcarbamoyladenylate synthase
MKDSIIDQQAIRLAARKLEAGALVAFPTETVYGLGADAELISLIGWSRCRRRRKR